MPIADNIVNRLIKSYFSLSPLFKGKKSKRVQIRFKRLSLNRILVSKAEMKHTNNKVIITVYLYNKNRNFFIYKLKTLYKTFILKIPSLSDLASKTKKKTSKRKTIVSRNKYRFSTTKNNNKTMLSNVASKSNFNSKPYAKSYTITKPYKATKHLRLTNSIATAPNANITLKRPRGLATKRFKTSNSLVANGLKSYKTKIYNYMNSTNLTQSRLSRFIVKIKNVNIKNKYKTLIRDYYSMLNNYKFYNVNNNKNYYLNYVNLSKDGYNSKIYYTSNFYTLLNKNNQFGSLATKRKNISYESIMAKRKISMKNKYRALATRNIKNMMYKLKSVSKILNINNLLNNTLNNRPESSLAFILDDLTPKNNFLTNMYRLLKKPSTISPSKRAKALTTSRVVSSLSAISSKSKEKINIISLKALRLINKARKHKNFLLRTLK